MLYVPLIEKLIPSVNDPLLLMVRLMSIRVMIGQRHAGLDDRAGT